MDFEGAKIEQNGTQETALVRLKYGFWNKSFRKDATLPLENFLARIVITIVDFPSNILIRRRL